MIRRITAFLLTGFLFLVSLAAQGKAPAWYLDKETQYPGRSFIAAIGEGNTRTEAEAAAAALVSLFFNTTTEIRNEAIREFNEAVQNNTTEFSKKTYITESAVIKSEEEFLGLRFANPWQDQNRRTWAALAYIDRNEAAGIYASRIAANMAAVNALAQDADREGEVLYACALLYRASVLGEMTEEYIKNAVTVDPASAERYRAHSSKIQAVQSGYRAKRSALSFSVDLRGPDNTGRIGRKLSSLLENAGYAVSQGRTAYTLQARLSMEQEITGGGTHFVTPGITIRIDREGKTLFSYNKTGERSGSRSSMNTAVTRALMELEADLEQHFITQFTAMLGR